MRPHIPRGYVYTLHDIGLVINKLMGGAYRYDYGKEKNKIKFLTGNTIIYLFIYFFCGKLDRITRGENFDWFMQK